MRLIPFLKGACVCLLCAGWLTACTKNASERQGQKRQLDRPVEVPSFSADSAWRYVQQQVDFGARVPNTPEHAACAAFLAGKLRSFGAEVTEQRADLRAFDGTVLKAVNIIGSFRPETQKRVLLFAHWDTRPWADNDAEPANRAKPVLGANDGASGVGVLLEVARQVGMQQPNVGVDIAFFDAEDYGAPEHVAGVADSWALGSQYWAKHPHVPGYKAQYGILLDMVGAPNATFYREQISEYYAAHVVDKVWAQADALGFGGYFINRTGGAITDDHLYVNRLAGIPSIDIIQRDVQSDTGFGAYWHTVHDTMDHIDKNTLMAVGMTLMYVIYNE